MRFVPGVFAIAIAAMGCSSSAFAFSAIGLKAAIVNCLNRDVPSPERIEACNESLHTNILLPRDRAKVITSRGNAYFAAANLNSALDDYNRAIKLNPELQPALVNRGVALLRVGKCGQAIADFRAALSSDSHSWQALYGRSLCETTAGDQPGAQSDLAAATAVNPNAAQEFAPVEIARWFQ
jgi:tetratricopeptide (TPR) repeat protein